MLARVSQGCKAYRVGTQPPPMVISLACTNKMSARGTMRANKQKSQMVISPTCTKQNVCRRYHEGKTHTHGLHHMVTRGVYKSHNSLFIHFGGLSRQSTLTQTTRGDTSGAQKAYSSSKGSSSWRGPSTEMRFAEMIFSFSLSFSLFLA